MADNRSPLPLPTSMAEIALRTDTAPAFKRELARAATIMVRLRFASEPARVNGKRPLLCVLVAANLAAKRLSTPEGVKVINQSFEGLLNFWLESAAIAGITKGDSTSEPAASNAAAKTAFFRRKGLLDGISVPDRLPVGFQL